MTTLSRKPGGWCIGGQHGADVRAPQNDDSHDNGWCVPESDARFAIAVHVWCAPGRGV